MIADLELASFVRP